MIVLIGPLRSLGAVFVRWALWRRRRRHLRGGRLRSPPYWVAVNMKNVRDRIIPVPGRQVLVHYFAGADFVPAIGVGHVKLAQGDLRCAYFVVPGAVTPFVVSHWSDCLGDAFVWPVSLAGKSTLNGARP